MSTVLTKAGGKVGIVLALAALLAAAFAFAGNGTAQATIHEGPIASWCSLEASGNTKALNPPGLSGQSSADNIAQPLIASGMLEAVPMFDPPGPEGPGVYLIPNTDHPASKVVLTGGWTEIEEGVFLANFEPDPDFAAFKHCPNLGGGGH